MSNALAETESPAGFNELAESEWQALETRVKRLSKVSFLPEAYRGKPDDIMAAGLALNAVGLPLTPRTISYVYVVKGRVDFMYQLISTLVHQHGAELWISEESNDSVTVCGQRAGSDRVHSATFTLADAQRAGLVDKNPTYKAYTRDMLVARAGKRCANRVCPEATLSLPPSMRFVPAPSAGAQARLEAVDAETGEIRDDEDIAEAELVDDGADQEPAAALATNDHRRIIRDACGHLSPDDLAEYRALPFYRSVSDESMTRDQANACIAWLETRRTDQYRREEAPF